MFTLLLQWVTNELRAKGLTTAPHRVVDIYWRLGNEPLLQSKGKSGIWLELLESVKTATITKLCSLQNKGLFLTLLSTVGKQWHEDGKGSVPCSHLETQGHSILSL